MLGDACKNKGSLQHPPPTQTKQPNTQKKKKQKKKKKTKHTKKKTTAEDRAPLLILALSRRAVLLRRDGNGGEGMRATGGRMQRGKGRRGLNGVEINVGSTLLSKHATLSARHRPAHAKGAEKKNKTREGKRKKEGGEDRGGRGPGGRLRERLAGERGGDGGRFLFKGILRLYDI